LISTGGSGDNIDTVSLQCLADNSECNSLTVLLSVSPVNNAALDCPDDIILRLSVPHASEIAHEIRVVVSVFDFVRSVLLVFSLINVRTAVCMFMVLSNNVILMHTQRKSVNQLLPLQTTPVTMIVAMTSSLCSVQ